MRSDVAKLGMKLWIKLLTKSFTVFFSGNVISLLFNDCDYQASLFFIIALSE